MKNGIDKICKLRYNSFYRTSLSVWTFWIVFQKKKKKVLTKAFKCVILSKLPMQHKSELWQINNNATLKILKSKQHQCCGSEKIQKLRTNQKQ